MKTISKIYLFAVAGLVLAACEKPPAAQKAEAVETAPVAKAEGKEYQIDVAKSSVLWIGTKKIGKHNGTINLKSGSVFVKDGAIVAGKFVADFFLSVSSLATIPSTKVIAGTTMIVEVLLGAVVFIASALLIAPGASRDLVRIVRDARRRRQAKAAG